MAVLASAVMLAAGPALAQDADLSLAAKSTPHKLSDGGVVGTIGPIGSSGKYTYTVTNAGPNAATDVVMATTLPETTEITAIVSKAADGGFVSSWKATKTGWGEILVDGGVAMLEDGGAVVVTGDPVLFPTLAASESGTVTVSLLWSPSELPATCNTAFDLTATVSSAATDATPENNAVTLTDVTIPIADLTGTLEFANPTTLRKPAENVEFTGTITNNGPCAVPAGELQIDASLDNSASFGISFVSGGTTGACTDWPVAGDTSDGTCSVPAAVAAGSTITFTFTEKVSALPDSNNGGDNIIRSAADVSYNVNYDGNPALLTGDNLSPVVTVGVKGPATECSMTGGPISVLGLLGYGLVLRRKKSKR